MHTRLRFSSVVAHALICLITLASCARVTHAVIPGDRIRGVGFREFRLSDPVGHGEMSAVVFYPSAEPSTTTAVGPYDIRARRNAPVSGEHLGLVVISHGTMGSMWDLHDLAEWFAGQGYVAASLTHPRDNFRDRSGLGTDVVLLGRPAQASALITQVLSNPRFSHRIDPDRVIAAGFSAGGYTALVMAGAEPQFSLLPDYCARHRDPTFCWRGSKTQVRKTGIPRSKDPRVRAVIALAPVGLYFSANAIRSLRVPVMLADGAADDVTVPKYNSERIASILGIKAFMLFIPRAGHFVFLSPCSKRMRLSVPMICVDPPTVDRAAVHGTVERAITQFLQRAFGKPAQAR